MVLRLQEDFWGLTFVPLAGEGVTTALCQGQPPVAHPPGCSQPTWATLCVPSSSRPALNSSAPHCIAAISPPKVPGVGWELSIQVIPGHRSGREQTQNHKGRNSKVGLERMVEPSSNESWCHRDQLFNLWSQAWITVRGAFSQASH